MKPIYFPFTYIPDVFVHPLIHCFGEMIVLQPVLQNQPVSLRALSDKGQVEIRVPCPEEEERLMACSREFRDWGRLHYGEEGSLKDVFKNGFFSQAFTSQIRTDILKSPHQSTFPEPDPVFSARLFLIMAQELDLQQNEINEKLALSIDDELDLFTSMTGERKTLNSKQKRKGREDFGAYKTGVRMDAWFRLLKLSSDKSPFLLTTSPAVFDEMIERLTGLEKILDFMDISCRQPDTSIRELNDWLKQLSENPWVGIDPDERPELISGTDQTCNFKLYILPKSSPDMACDLFLGEKDENNQSDFSVLNTLVGLMEV